MSRTGTRALLAITGLLAMWAGATACGAGDATEATTRETPEPGTGAEVAASTASRNPDFQAGRWRRYRTHQFDADLTPEQRERIRMLEAIGYLDGSLPPAREGSVVVFDRERAYAGLNFYSSGHAPEAVLMDMEGNVLHRWSYAFEAIWPDYPIDPSVRHRHFWRRAHLFENGDVLAIHEGLGILKLDADSNLLWAQPIRAHHDFEVQGNGEIFVLTREAHLVPSVSEETPTLEDFVTVLAPDGSEKSRLSLLQAFENAPDHAWREASARFWRNEGKRKLASTRDDIFHTNSVRVLDGRHADRLPAFAKGNLLVSFCHLNMIAVVDPRENRVVWSLGERFKLQHDPSLTSDGRVLVFNNHAVPHRASSVMALDPVSGEVAWEYKGSDESPFYSRTCGTAQQLGNGNLLITESDNGRALEITPDGETVWEFYNPHRAGDEDQFIATLFEVVRLGPEFPVDWARGRD